MDSSAGIADSSHQSQIQDIHTYLATLQKDIGDGGGSTIVSLPSDQLFSQSAEGGLTSQLLSGVDGVQSFIQVTPEDQAGLTQTIQSVEPGVTPVHSSQAGQIQPSIVLPQMIFAGSGVSSQPQYIQPLTAGQTVNTLGEGSSDQVGHVLVEQPQAAMLAGGVGEEMMEGEEERGSVVLNTGNSYQTVTIVPTSEVNPSGEVSYVLIVSQPDAGAGVTGGDEKTEPDDTGGSGGGGGGVVVPGGGGDLSVFDFKEGAGMEVGEDDEEEGGEGSHQHVEGELAGEGGAAGGGGSGAKKAVVKFTVGGRTRTVTQLMCNYCNYTSPKRYLLTRHMKTHSEERPHKCSICDRGFKTVASLQNHINTHTGVKPHKCKECNATFTTSGELVRHVRYRHTYEKPHKCPDCDYASVELSKLKRHIRSHTGERPYQCPHCSYASPDTYKLKRHLRIHTGEKPYECEICHARFTQSNSLKAHKMIHTGEKPVFQCELCPTTCGRKTDLKIHVQKLHTSESPITCKKCGKSFPDRYTFKIHMKTHDGQKCFRCELCPYAAMTQRHLESHILTHTGEKPFKCDECDMSFRQKQLLRRHKNLYHTPNYQPPLPKEKRHECLQCSKSFAHKGNMLRHMALHDPDNPMYQEYNILKMEEEGGEMGEEEEEEEEEDNSLDVIHEPETTEYQPTQVQVQLVNEAGEHTGQIYLQLENPEATVHHTDPLPGPHEVLSAESEMYPTEQVQNQVIKVEQMNNGTASQDITYDTGEVLCEVVHSQM